MRLMLSPGAMPSKSSSSEEPELPVATALGVNLYAKQVVDGRDRPQLERLCRYVMRPPLSQERLEWRPDGGLLLTLKNVWKDGTHAISLEPHDLLVRLCAMGNFNEELVKAGVMLAGDGLKPSSEGKRVRFSGGKKTVIDGPFTETKELIAGYWIWQVKSWDEALEWVRRCPDPMPGEESEIELRPVFEMEDFGEVMTPELRAQEERLRDEVERKNKS